MTRMKELAYWKSRGMVTNVTFRAFLELTEGCRSLVFSFSLMKKFNLAIHCHQLSKRTWRRLFFFLQSRLFSSLLTSRYWNTATLTRRRDICLISLSTGFDFSTRSVQVHPSRSEQGAGSHPGYPGRGAEDRPVQRHQTGRKQPLHFNHSREHRQQVGQGLCLRVCLCLCICMQKHWYATQKHQTSKSASFFISSDVVWPSKT